MERIERGHAVEDVRGIYYREDGRIIRTDDRQPIQNIDELPFPDQGSFPIKDYFALKGFRELSIISARGCPGRCTFCYPTVRNMFGNKIRYRSANNIVDEIEHLIKEFKIDMVTFSDDTLTVSSKRMIELSKEINRRGVQILWRGQTRVNSVNKEMLTYMKKGGCYLLAFGVESGSQRILDTIRKDINVQQIKDAFRTCKEVGILAHAYLMVGNHGETLDDIRETIELIKEIKPFNVNISIATPYPGTDLYEIAKRSGVFANKDWSTFDHILESTSFLENLTMPYEKIIEAKRMIEKTHKEHSRKVDDLFNLLLKNMFILKIGRIALKNPSFINRSAKLTLKSFRTIGFDTVNPMKAK